MKLLTILFSLLFAGACMKAQTGQRIPLIAAADPALPAWDYSSYLTDNLDSLVTSVWGQGEYYSTVILTLASKTIVNRLSLYDYTGVFTTHPAYLYAINGADTTLIGKFTGEQYESFINLPLPFPLVATKICIRKYGNNIPQKVQVFGQPYQQSTTADPLAGRLAISNITSTINTGMDFTPWLSDSLSSLVESVWGAANQQYADVRVQLSARSQVSKISLYDNTGVFTTNPASVYLQKDTTLQLIGLFEGLLYQQFVDYPVSEGRQADAIIIRKYGNNIPQKVQVYGRPLPADPFADSVQLPIPPPPPPPPPVDTVPANTYTKIPIEASRWYILNYAPNGIGALFNGITVENISTGYAGFCPTYQCIYPLNDGEAISLSQVKMYDYNGIFTDNPATISAIKKDGSKVTLATFTGSKYMEWVGPYPGRNTTGPTMFNLDSTVKDIQYLVITCTNNNLPTEMEFYGAYTAQAAPTTMDTTYSTFNKTLGMNGFEWDFVNPNTSSAVIDEAKYAAIKNFRGFRHYLDWKQMEGTEGKYTFNPSSAGGWNYDMTYERCKRDSIEVLACIKNTPEWMESTYPDSMQATDNAPLKYGLPKDSVASYIEKGRMAFQFTARYGRNANIPLSLLKVDTLPRWTFDPPNEVKVGLGLVKYVECGNELDKWWKGANGYMNAYQYAALLSAFYDGHKGSLGAGVGVKTADSTMQVVMGGLALASPGYVRAMIEWCRQHRGYKADGKIDLCWDVINYHHYSNDAGQSQQGNPTRGAAPEVSDAIPVAQSFVNMARQFAYGMPVWITELGFDVNQQSPLKAIAIGDKSVLQTQAGWILRSSLTYLSAGISGLFYYELKDFDISNATQFASMGLTDTLYHRKPAMDYLYQTNRLMGNYRFNRRLQQLPVIDEYENEGKYIYAVWVPDEKGATFPCSLPFLNADSVILYRPAIGSDELKAETIAVKSGCVQLIATETPQFVAQKPTPENQLYVRRVEN